MNLKIEEGVDKNSARELAHFASTFEKMLRVAVSSELKVVSSVKAKNNGCGATSPKSRVITYATLSRNESFTNFMLWVKVEDACLELLIQRFKGQTSELQRILQRFEEFGVVYHPTPRYQ